MEIALNTTLHKNQQNIHDSSARFKVVKAGKKFGKSHWAEYEICKLAGQKPGGLFWYVAPTYSQAKDIAWRDLKRILPERVVKRRLENELKIEFVNNAVLQLKGAENEDALRGPNLDGIALDEVAYIQEYLWSGILRSQLAASQGPAFFISSPNRHGRNWYTNFCESANKKMLAGDKDWGYWYYTIHDNPILSKIEIEKIHDETPDDKWNLEYMGIESDFAGPLYGEFNPSLHVQEFPGNTSLPMFRGLDWGIAHPTVCLWVEVDMNDCMVYVLNEYVKSGAVISDNCDYIIRFTPREPQWTVIDPSTAKRNSQTKVTDMDEFRRCGIPCQPADNNARGIDVLKMFFKRNRIKIHPRCKNLILQLKNLQHDDTEGDDCPDVLRYIVLRIHDSVRGMNILQAENKPIVYNHKAESNFNDPVLFPKKKYEGQTMGWINEELDFVA